MAIEIYQENGKEYSRFNKKLEVYCAKNFQKGIPIVVFIDNILTYKITKLYKSSDGRATILRIHNILTNQVTEVEAEDIFSHQIYKELTNV